MRAVAAFVLVAVLSLGVAQESTTKNGLDQLNVIESKPSARLDPYIRKALLKALSDLEESGSITEFGDSTSVIRNTEQLATETSKDNIKFHSFIVNGQEAFTQSTNTAPLVVDKKISILSTTTGNVENYETSGTLPTQDPFPEILQTKESGATSQQVRSIQETPQSNNAVRNNIKFSNFKPFSRSSTITTSTTTTTTTTTTPKPTHNSDGENIEAVDKRDVQVYQAPLLAAFTVQQDANGVPKKVIPIFQTSSQDLKLASSSNYISTSSNKGQNDYITLQLNLQRELEEKQRILEEQLRLLEFHQRQQEQILRQQQLLIQQKEAQRQQQIYLEQERFNRVFPQQNLNGNTNNLHSHLLVKPLPQGMAPINGPFQTSPQVSIQKSSEYSKAYDQSNIIPNQQQLPNREAVDFLYHLRHQQKNQFPLQENHLPQGINNILRPKPNFNQALTTYNNQISTPNDLPGHSSRVFRKESGVGNFGINYQNTNRFNLPMVNYNNRFFTEPNQFNSDYDLKQLLAQGGLNGRAREDLSIVSQVLSLNHGIANSNDISRPFDGRRQRFI